MKVLEGLLYTKDHEWVRVEEDKAYIGITDFAQDALGDIVYVELPEVGEEYSVKDTLVDIESVKAASEVFMPFDGEVLEVNEQLLDNPELINEDAFKNWIVAVKVEDDNQLEKLLDATAYQKYCDEEE